MHLVQGFAHCTTDGQARNKGAYTASTMASVGRGLLGALSLGLCVLASAQTPAVESTPAVSPPATIAPPSVSAPAPVQGAEHKGAAPVTPALAVAIEPAWNKLTVSQRETLGPLAGLWDSMGEARKRKWLAVAATAPSLAASERQKMHERMEAWARLSRNEREQARLNFTQSKSLGKSSRAADWEAYQALSADERKRLADAAHHKPAGAALSLKPVPEVAVIQIPVTRHTPLPERSAVIAQLPLDRRTLLPLAPPPQTTNGTKTLEKP